MTDCYSGIDITAKQNASFGIYVHIPFCPHLCPYCDFVKTTQFRKGDVETLLRRSVDDILTRLPEELNQHQTTRAPVVGSPSRGAPNRPQVTLYFGGGTPGLFWGDHYRLLIEAVERFAFVEECTLEANPYMISPAKAQSWFDAGINRVTLGVQSLNPSVLDFLGRKHTADQVNDSLKVLRKSGLNNIQVDVIYGLPKNTTKRNLSQELKQMAGEGATGASSYALTIEEQTAFFQKGVIPCEDKAADEYEEILEICDRLGWTQRETSNFSQFECKHNNIYWYGHPYLGVGTGAHGLSPQNREHPYGRRYFIGPKERQQTQPGNDSLEFSKRAEQLLCHNWEPERSRRDYLTELSFTLLRTPEGIPLSWLEQHIPANVQNTLLQEATISRGIQSERLLLHEGHLRLKGCEQLLGDRWHRDLLRSLELL